MAVNYELVFCIPDFFDTTFIRQYKGSRDTTWYTFKVMTNKNFEIIDTITRGDFRLFQGPIADLRIDTMDNVRNMSSYVSQSKALQKSISGSVDVSYIKNGKDSVIIFIDTSSVKSHLHAIIWRPNEFGFYVSYSTSLASDRFSDQAELKERIYNELVECIRNARISQH